MIYTGSDLAPITPCQNANNFGCGGSRWKRSPQKMGRGSKIEKHRKYAYERNGGLPLKHYYIWLYAHTCLLVPTASTIFISTLAEWKCIAATLASYKRLGKAVMNDPEYK